MQLPTIITAAVEGAAFHFDKPYSYLWQEADVAPQPGLRVRRPLPVLPGKVCLHRPPYMI